MKSNGCTLSFYSPATLEIFFGRKTKCWTENKIQKAVTFSKIRLARYSDIEACFPVAVSVATDDKEKN